MRIVGFVLVWLCLAAAMAQNQIPFATYSGLFPHNVFEFGTFQPGVVVKITAKYNPLVAFSIIVFGGTDITSFVTVTTSTALGSGEDSFEFTTSGVRRRYAVTAIGSTITEVSFKAQVGGVDIYQSDKRLLYSMLTEPLLKFTLANATLPCRLKFDYFGVVPGTVNLYATTGIVQVALPGDKVFINSTTIDFPIPGDYYIKIEMTNPTLDFIPWTLTISTYCDSFCVNALNPTPAPACSTCGNGLLENLEQCDNGNRPGCISCVVEPGYQCLGNLGSTSVCSKDPICGDGILDRGEQCDNQNRLGCTFNCTIDAGFNCSGALNAPSVCNLCGNGIVEPGEQCDNRNAVGCSSGCKVDPGFACQGASNSFCYRRNPVCGNKVIEVGEACDDGNTVAGDGCGATCLVEIGFNCQGEFGGFSNCTVAPPVTEICGNGIYEVGGTSTELCDNGNRPGCLGCTIQDGWSCTNQVGFPSVCTPNVVIPHCGNGVYEPLQYEVCDDGNIANGDGCNSFCQIQYGWTCINGTKCINLQDQTSQAELQRTYCGNGRIDRSYGETCDDANKVSGDGCSSACRVETGWSCQVYSLSGRSYCARDSTPAYCGNGIVEGSEQCDDGFPLRNNDGCSTSCRIEAGWNCGTSTYPPIISRCWRV